MAVISLTVPCYVVVLLPSCGQTSFVNQKGQHNVKSKKPWLLACSHVASAGFPKAASPWGSLCTHVSEQTYMWHVSLVEVVCKLQLELYLMEILRIQFTCLVFTREVCNARSNLKEFFQKDQPTLQSLELLWVSERMVLAVGGGLQPHKAHS